MEDDTRFGSKAKLEQQTTEGEEILEVCTSDALLDEIESPKKRPKIQSVIVRPVQTDRQPRGLGSSHNLHTNQQQRSSKVNTRFHTADPPPRTRGSSLVKRAKAPAPLETQVVWSTRPQRAKTFESRGTQTDRIGACKCARSVQSRNQRRRQQNKQNNQIVQILERTNILQFTNEAN